MIKRIEHISQAPAYEFVNDALLHAKQYARRTGRKYYVVCFPHPTKERHCVYDAQEWSEIKARKDIVYRVLPHGGVS